MSRGRTLLTDSESDFPENPLDAKVKNEPVVKDEASDAVVKDETVRNDEVIERGAGKRAIKKP